jgi:hypothetical protein
MVRPRESNATWADVVKDLIDTFLLLRDIFAYALLGGLFLGLGVASGRLRLNHLSELFAPYHPPSWALAILLIATCYILGVMLVAIAYLRVDFWTMFHWSDPDWLADYPTEANPRDLYLRHYSPDLFREMDRRERLAVLASSCVVALLLAWLVFFIFHPTLGDVIIWAAILVFLDTVTTMSHLTRVRKAIHAAGALIEEREKAAAEAEKTIQPSGDELRFVIDAIFRAAELASPKEPQAQSQPPVPSPAEAPSSQVTPDV